MTSKRERTAVYALVVVLVLFRSALFTFTKLSFDSDQAVIGLMAKHLTEGRAFPLFMYGQNYMLGLESWLAAPLFMLFGVSVAALKFPILLLNLAVALLTVRILERDCRMRPRDALLAGIFIVLPAAGTMSTLQEASGGTVEPLLYILLLWNTRNRPVWFGVIAAFGVIHREFTIYGVGVTLGMAILNGAWRRRESWFAFGRGLAAAAGVYAAVAFLRPFSSALGPGTGPVIPGQPPNSVAEILNRVCFDAGTIVPGFKGLVTQHWAQLFGTTVMPLKSQGLESAMWQGVAWSGAVLGVAALLMTARTLTLTRLSADWWRRYAFAVYLAAVGGISAAVYVLARCGTESPIRYDTLSLFLPVAIAAVFLTSEPRRVLRLAGIAVILAWAGVSSLGHARLWAEYVPHPPVTAKEVIVQNLEARGIRYATSDYWIAYHVSFLTNERVIVAADAVIRIKEYQDLVAAHKDEAIRISRRRCGDVAPVFPGVYFCPLQSP